MEFELNPTTLHNKPENVNVTQKFWPVLSLQLKKKHTHKFSEKFIEYKTFLKIFNTINFERILPSH